MCGEDVRRQGLLWGWFLGLLNRHLFFAIFAHPSYPVPVSFIRNSSIFVPNSYPRISPVTPSTHPFRILLRVIPSNVVPRITHVRPALRVSAMFQPNPCVKQRRNGHPKERDSDGYATGCEWNNILQNPHHRRFLFVPPNAYTLCTMYHLFPLRTINSRTSARSPSFCRRRHFLNSFVVLPRVDVQRVGDSFVRFCWLCAL